jgi:hypothetical protein
MRRTYKYVVKSKHRHEGEEKKMADLNVNVPSGPNAVSTQVFDQFGNDITGSCTLTASSSNPAGVAVGAAAGGDPDTIPLTDGPAGQSAEITYVASNAEGQIQDVDTLNVVPTAPATMVRTYQYTIVTPPAPAPAAPAAPAAASATATPAKS